MAQFCPKDQKFRHQILMARGRGLNYSPSQKTKLKTYIPGLEMGKYTPHMEYLVTGLGLGVSQVYLAQFSPKD